MKYKQLSQIKTRFKPCATRAAVISTEFLKVYERIVLIYSQVFDTARFKRFNLDTVWIKRSWY